MTDVNSRFDSMLKPLRTSAEEHHLCVKTDIRVVVCMRERCHKCYYVQVAFVLRFLALPFANTELLIYDLLNFFDYDAYAILLFICAFSFSPTFSAKQQVQKIKAEAFEVESIHS